MKKIIKLTESDLTKIVKRVLVEMVDKKLSPMDWEEIWFKLRKVSRTFAFPEFKNGYFSFGGLDFYYNEDDGSLELAKAYRDPYAWRNTYEDGVEVLEKYANKVESLIEESGLDLKFEMGPKFNMRISKR